MKALSPTDGSECPFNFNFTFAFLEDSVAVQLDKAANIYFPHIRAGSSLKDVTADFKAIATGRMSMYCCVRLKNGSTQQCQVFLRHQQKNFSPENEILPSLRNLPSGANVQSVAQEAPQPAAAVADPLYSPPPRALPPFSQASSLLGRTTAYEQACFLDYSNDIPDAEGAPVYTMTHTRSLKTRRSLHSLHNCTIDSRSAAVAVSHMVNLAAMKNGSYYPSQIVLILSKIKDFRVTGGFPFLVQSLALEEPSSSR